MCFQTLTSCWTWLIERKHGPTRELSVETMERIIKILQGNHHGVWQKLDVPSQPFLKFGANINKMERLQKKKKKNIQADQGRPQSVRIENSKQFALKIEIAQ